MDRRLPPRRPERLPFAPAKATVVLLLLLAWLGMACAHDLPVNRMVNAFVRVQGNRAELIARVPTDLLRGVPFPTVNGHYDMTDLTRAEATVSLAVMLLADSFVLAENGTRLMPFRSEGRLVASSDRSFDHFQHALEPLQAAARAQPPIAYDSGYLVVHYSYPVTSAHARFEIQSQVAVDVGVLAPLTVRFQRDDEAGRAMIVEGGAAPVDLDPLWYRAAGGFVVLGIEHILSGTDHLLFLLCLVVPVRRLRHIVPVITAFTVAHSVTLIASAMGLAPRGDWFPPLVEAAIAASIVYTAIENIALRAVGQRWFISCLFGLIHGFGFSNALGDSLQFAGRHLLVSLLGLQCRHRSWAAGRAVRGAAGADAAAAMVLAACGGRCAVGAGRHAGRRVAVRTLADPAPGRRHVRRRLLRQPERALADAGPAGRRRGRCSCTAGGGPSICLHRGTREGIQ